MSELKRNIPNRNLIVFIIVISFLLMIGYVSASSIDSIQLLKISAQDQRAVIKTTDGKMKVIKTGDVLRVTSGELRVVEITVGRVVLEEKTGNETEKVVIRLEDGKQRVERIKKAGEKQPQLYSVKTPHEQKPQSKESAKEKKKKR